MRFCILRVFLTQGQFVLWLYFCFRFCTFSLVCFEFSCQHHAVQLIAWKDSSPKCLAGRKLYSLTHTRSLQIAIIAQLQTFQLAAGSLPLLLVYLQKLPVSRDSIQTLEVSVCTTAVL